MANYKTSWVQRLIDGAWQKTFAFAHAKTVYTDFANKKTLADKLSEIDTEIGNKANKTEIPTELPANGGNSSTVNGHTVKSNVPENAVFTDTVYDDTAIKKSIDDIEIGGRNLFLRTDVERKSSDFRITAYEPADSPLVDGEQYIATICVTPASGTKNITLFFSGGYQSVATFNVNDVKKQIISVPFVMKYSTGREPDINVVYSYAELYRFPNNGAVTGETTIHWIKIEKGNKATDWTPAPEDTEAEIQAVDNKLTTNLLNPTLQTTTKNGVTCTNNGDGTYTLNGTATNDAEFIICSFYFGDESYKLIGTPKGISNAYLYISYNGSDVGDGLIVTGLSSELTVGIYINRGVVLPNVIFKPMITNNLNATYDDFVPYTGDSGSLNGDVADLRDDMNYVSHIKFTNIAWIDSTASMFSSETNGIAYEYMGDGAIKISGTVGSNSIEQEIARFIGEIPDSVGRGKVKLLGLPFDTSNESFNIGLKISGPGGAGTVARTSSKDGVIIDLSKITSSASISGIYLSIPNGTVIPNDFIIRPFLTTNLNATLNDFVPYTGSKGQLNDDLSQAAYIIGNPSKLLTDQKILVNAINELNNRLTALENK